MQQKSLNKKDEAHATYLPNTGLEQKERSIDDPTSF